MGKLYKNYVFDIIVALVALVQLRLSGRREVEV